MKEQNRLFDELAVGDSRSLERLCTENDMIIFAKVSGNHNPMSLPDFEGDGVAEDHLGPPRVSGMFLGSIISAILGNLLPGPGTLYRKQSLVFHEIAYAGDELLCEVTVTAKDPKDQSITLDTTITRIPDKCLILSGEAEVQAPTKRITYNPEVIPGLLVQRHQNYEKLLKMVENIDPIPTAIVCPEEANSLAGAIAGWKHKMIIPFFIGNADQILKTAEGLNEDISSQQIYDIKDPAEAASLAVKMVNEGKVNAIMKGHLHTDTLLHPMMDKQTGLRQGRRITHVFVLDTPGIPEPIIVSDAAINIQPDLQTKVDIVRNAIDVAHAIGIKEPRVAILSAVETVNPDIPSSIDGAILSKMADRGQITGAKVDGPLAMDNAIDLGAARSKGIKSEVAGRSNILITPNLDAGNILIKQLRFISHAEGAGLVLGAKVPVILNSRSDGKMSRLASCAIAVLHHQYHQKGKL